MKTFIGVLIFLSFLQSSVLPLDLVLIILICRSYIREDSANLFLGFGFGMFLDFLNINHLGLQSLIYLGLIQITQVLSKTRLSGNSLLIVPLTLILLSINELVLRDFNFLKIIFESLISLPIFYIVRIWEERFIPRKEIKLRV